MHINSSNITIIVIECAFIVIEIRWEALKSLMGSLEVETGGQWRKKRQFDCYLIVMCIWIEWA